VFAPVSVKYDGTPNNVVLSDFLAEMAELPGDFDADNRICSQ
jgi:hypothetical protein